MKNKNVYGYLIVSDEGFAPCYDDNLFTLACCKPDIRKSIIKNHTDGNGNLLDEVWVVAAKHTGKVSNGKYKSRLVYAAKITQVLRFEEYYECNEYKTRTDCIYQSLNTDKCKIITDKFETEKDSKLIALIKKAYIGKQMYHKINNKNCPSKNEIDQFRRDISGLCVLVSREYYYFGEANEFGEFDSVKNHCENRRPGSFFYVDISTKDLKSFVSKNQKYKNSSAPASKNSKSKCS